MLGIFLAIALIWFLAYKGWSTIWVAPIAAAIVALLGGMNLLQTYKGAYMTGFAGYAVQWFPVFMLGAVFGKMMDTTNMAKSVALGISKLIGPRFAVLAVVLAGSILTYGGVSMFVAVFCLYPLALVLYREANIPRRLIPAAVTVGVFAYTMVCLPGTPQIQNLIPGQFFGTSPTAAPVLGLICGILMGGSGTLYVMWREKVYKARGEHFTEPPSSAPEDPNERLPNIWLSILPMVLIVVTLNIFKWDIIVSLLAGILLIIVFNVKKFKTFVSAINEGAKGSMMPIINVSAIVGFGAVVRAAPAFADLVKLVTSIPGSPLVSLAVAVNVLCGATGSASGGLSITLEALAPEYIRIAARDGISLEVMHRIAAIAASAMDTVPHNGAILTLLAVTGMSHRESYFDISITTIVIPLAVTAIGIVLASLGVV